MLEFLKKPEIYKFLVVGIISASLVLLLTIIFTSFMGLFYVYSVAVAFEIVLIGAFFAHDKWTFSHVKKTSRMYIRFAKFNIFSLITLGLNEAVLVFFTTQIGLHYIPSEAIAITLTFFFNYIISKKISFKN